MQVVDLHLDAEEARLYKYRIHFLEILRSTDCSAHLEPSARLRNLHLQQEVDSVMHQLT